MAATSRRPQENDYDCLFICLSVIYRYSLFLLAFKYLRAILQQQIILLFERKYEIPPTKTSNFIWRDRKYSHLMAWSSSSYWNLCELLRGAPLYCRRTDGRIYWIKLVYLYACGSLFKGRPSGPQVWSDSSCPTKSHHMSAVLFPKPGSRSSYHCVMMSQCVWWRQSRQATALLKAYQLFVDVFSMFKAEALLSSVIPTGWAWWAPEVCSL